MGWESILTRDQQVHKLLTVHLPICVHVHCLDHLLHLLVVQLLAQLGYHVPPLSCADQTLLSLLKMRKASQVWSSLSPAFTFQAIRPRSSGKPTGPLLSQSSSPTTFRSSAWVGFGPSDHRMVPSSCMGMVLLPSG